MLTVSGIAKDVLSTAALWRRISPEDAAQVEDVIDEMVDRLIAEGVKANGAKAVAKRREMAKRALAGASGEVYIGPQL